MKQQSLQKSKIKFLLLEGIHESAVDALGRAGYDNVVTYSKSLSTEELRKEIKDAHFVGIRSRTQLSEEVLEAAERLGRDWVLLHRYKSGRFNGRGAQRCARF
jgi:D-3-phosphoglycerate dehydrogenase